MTALEARIGRLSTPYLCETTCRLTARHPVPPVTYAHRKAVFVIFPTSTSRVVFPFPLTTKPTPKMAPSAANLTENVDVMGIPTCISL